MDRNRLKETLGARVAVVFFRKQGPEGLCVGIFPHNAVFLGQQLHFMLAYCNGTLILEDAYMAISKDFRGTLGAVVGIIAFWESILGVPLFRRLP